MQNIIVENIFLVKELSGEPPEHLFQVIKGESPQIISVFLSRIDAKTSRKILENFPLEEQKDIAYRMANIVNVSADVLNTALKNFKKKLEVFKDDNAAFIDGSDKLAKILSHLPPGKSKELLSGLSKKDETLAEKIQDKMFTFEDIMKIDDKSLREVLIEIPLETLAMSLKGTEKSFKEKIFKNLSDKKRLMLKEEMEYLGPQKKSAVDYARQDLLEILKKKQKLGRILFEGDTGFEKWVE